ncbi:MAG TPA: hypothetical protein DCG33_04975 [Prevotellaceae bacterium]|jgi:hypothetical protein|nr:hypothetical protein [Prevotellaceae bacterium]
MKVVSVLLLALFTISTLLEAKENYLELKNGKICLRQDLTRGGAICYISKTGADRNIVNIHDLGRYIQQSYYAGKSVNRRPEGQAKVWSPWSWNPIQVGDHKGNPAIILDSKKEGNTLYVKCIPMQWDMTDKPAEAVMEQWTTLEGTVIKVRNRLTCQRTDTIYGEGTHNSQEIPAVYPISSLNRLYGYFGDAPFTNEEIDTTEVHEIIVGDPDHFWGVYNHVTEKWMAFVDDSGWGMGVYSPSATGFLAGRAGSSRQGESADAETSYIAPTRTQVMMKNSVVEYEYYLIVDNIDKIRKQIYKIHTKSKKS